MCSYYKSLHFSSLCSSPHSNFSFSPYPRIHPGLNTNLRSGLVNSRIPNLVPRLGIRWKCSLGPTGSFSHWSSHWSSHFFSPWSSHFSSPWSLPWFSPWSSSQSLFSPRRSLTLFCAIVTAPFVGNSPCPSLAVYLPSNLCTSLCTSVFIVISPNVGIALCSSLSIGPFPVLNNSLRPIVGITLCPIHEISVLPTLSDSLCSSFSSRFGVNV